MPPWRAPTASLRAAPRGSARRRRGALRARARLRLGTGRIEAVDHHADDDVRLRNANLGQARVGAEGHDHPVRGRSSVHSLEHRGMRLLP